MATVQVSDLEAKLGAQLDLVRRGEEVIVCDGDKPIARISRINADDYDEQTQRLIANGVLMPALEPMPEIWPMPPGDHPIPDDVMAEVWRFVRGDD